MTTYKVYTADTRTFLMEAPMNVIAAVFRLHRDAVRRIVSDLDGLATATDCHFNGKPVLLNLNRIVITKGDGR